jgi:hypothetical protein
MREARHWNDNIVARVRIKLPPSRRETNDAFCDEKRLIMHTVDMRGHWRGLGGNYEFRRSESVVGARSVL